jgi:hypothetical protein
MHRNVRAEGVQHVLQSIRSTGGYNNAFAMTVMETDYQYTCCDGNHRLTCLRQVKTLSLNFALA